jgi:hypothetical protein
MPDGQNLKYKPIPVMSRIEVEEAIQRDDPGELSIAVLAAALYSEEPEWPQEICLRLAGHSHNNVRGNAILGLGHIARIHRTLNRARGEPAIRDALCDPDEYVRGHASDAADDVEIYLGWQIPR